MRVECVGLIWVLTCALVILLVYLFWKKQQREARMESYIHWSDVFDDLQRRYWVSKGREKEDKEDGM